MRRKLITAIVFLCMLFTAYGCNTASKNIGRPQTVTNPGVDVSPTPVTNTQPQVTPAIVTPPAQLLTLEKNTLKIITDVNNKKWKTAANRMKSLKALVTVLRTKLPVAGVPVDTVNNIASSVDKLGEAITAKNAYDAQTYANEITKYIADATGSYTVLVPPDVMRLDYYLRQVEFSLAKKDMTLAQENITNAGSVWQALRAQIISTDANIAKMDSAIKAIEADINKKNNKTILRDVRKALVVSASIKKNFEKTGRKP